MIRLAPVLAFALFSCTPGAPVSNPAPSSPPPTSAAPSTPPKIIPPKIAPQKPSTPGRVTRIMLGDLFALQQDNRALIFDVRPSFIYKLGHIPGAINWPKNSFESQLFLHETEIIAAREANKPVILYCVDFACPDAREVATRLSQRGHSVAVLEGGWDAWKTGQLPVE